MIVVLLLSVITAIIFGVVIYLGLDFDKFKKASISEAAKTATVITDLTDTDLRLQTDYNRTIGDLASNVLLNDMALSNAQVMLRARLDSPLLSESNQTMLKERADDPLLSSSNQTALKNFFDNPFSSSSNLMLLKRAGAMITNPLGVTSAFDSNVDLEMLQRVSFLSGLTVKDLDDSNPMKFCFKSTGQCMKLDTNFDINPPNNVNMVASNIWMDAPVQIKSNQSISFKTDMTSASLASISYNTARGAIEVPSIATGRIQMVSRNATPQARHVDLVTTNDGGVAAVLNNNAKLHIASGDAATTIAPLITIERGTDNKMYISSGNAPIVINGDMEVRGTLKLRNAAVQDSNLAIPPMSLTSIASA